jgi:hypothetical protein
MHRRGPAIPREQAGMGRRRSRARNVGSPLVHSARPSAKHRGPRPSAGGCGPVCSHQGCRHGGFRQYQRGRRLRLRSNGSIKAAVHRTSGSHHLGVRRRNREGRFAQASNTRVALRHKGGCKQLSPPPQSTRKDPVSQRLRVGSQNYAKHRLLIVRPFLVKTHSHHRLYDTSS